MARPERLDSQKPAKPAASRAPSPSGVLPRRRDQGLGSPIRSVARGHRTAETLVPFQRSIGLDRTARPASILYARGCVRPAGLVRPRGVAQAQTARRRNRGRRYKREPLSSSRPRGLCAAALIAQKSALQLAGRKPALYPTRESRLELTWQAGEFHVTFAASAPSMGTAPGSRRDRARSLGPAVLNFFQNS